MKRMIAFLVLLGLLLVLRTNTARAQEHTIFTDADSGVRIICRNDDGPEPCFIGQGGDHEIFEAWSDDPAYIRVHDQNALNVGYWHFDLSDVDSNAEVVDARFQLDLQSNSWSDLTTISVFAIADPAKDWNLNELPETEITGPIAPQSDYDSFAWTGDPNDPQQRFNAPTPFLEEGDLPSSTVRLLEEFVDIEGTDAVTTGEPGEGNFYGGYACCDGPGTGGSSDGGDNPWPIKNAVDIDVTDLVRWKLGQAPAYSDFDPEDTELTIMVRTDFAEAGENGFVRFIAKESPYLGGPLDLQPGRIILDLIPPETVCDFDGNGACDIADLDALLYDGQAQQILDPYDLNGDGVVNLADRDEWYTSASAENGVELVPGDTNLDGLVVASDLNDLGTNWQSTDATSVAQGDFNGDGLVAAADLNDIGIFWQHGVAAAAVPEPSGCLALLVSMTMWLVTACRRSKN
jgi:hypothetical protein